MQGPSIYYIRRQFEILTGAETETTFPVPWYCDISTTTFDADGSGITLPTDVAYESYTFTNDAKFSTLESSTAWVKIGNSFDWTFPPALVSWGTITAFLLTTTVSSVDEAMFGGPLTNPTYIASGSTPIFLTHDVVFTDYFTT